MFNKIKTACKNKSNVVKYLILKLEKMDIKRT